MVYPRFTTAGPDDISQLHKERAQFPMSLTSIIAVNSFSSDL